MKNRTPGKNHPCSRSHSLRAGLLMAFAGFLLLGGFAPGKALGEGRSREDVKTIRVTWVTKYWKSLFA